MTGWSFLDDWRITNAVRCVPPENKPLPVEINTCLEFLLAEIAVDAKSACDFHTGREFRIKATLVSALRLKKKDHAFGHGARHEASGSLSSLSRAIIARATTRIPAF